MARSYAERNAASIRATGKSLYERRVERGIAAGLSRDQARGHPNPKKSEPLVTQLPKPQRPPRQKPQLPRTPRPQTPITKLRQAKKGRVADIKRGTSKADTPVRGVTWEGQRMGRLHDVIDHIATTDYAARVKIAVKDKDGTWRTLYKKGGREAASLADSINTSDSMYDWLMEELEEVYEGADDIFGGPGEIEWSVMAIPTGVAA